MTDDRTGSVTATSDDATDSATTRIVLVDARPERRAVMHQMFEHSSVTATVVGEADSAADAVIAVDDHGADLVVIDFQLPVQGVLETVATLRARFPALGIVVCSFNRDVAIKESAVDAGADAYIVKPASARDVMAAVRGLPPRASAVLTAAAR